MRSLIHYFKQFRRNLQAHVLQKRRNTMLDWVCHIIFNRLSTQLRNTLNTHWRSPVKHSVHNLHNIHLLLNNITKRSLNPDEQELKMRRAGSFLTLQLYDKTNRFSQGRSASWLLHQTSVNLELVADVQIGSGTFKPESPEENELQCPHFPVSYCKYFSKS